MSSGYVDTFIHVAADCPAANSVIPEGKKETKPVHVLQYELLQQYPYQLTQEDLIYEVHIRHKAVHVDNERQKEMVWNELFSKPHPCMRASMLPKKYGWGVHFNGEGKIALYPMESDEYTHFTASGNVKVLAAMRNKKAK